jgi:hypothetical protein
MRPSTREQSRTRRCPIRWPFILIAFVMAACGSSSHSDEHDSDAGHTSDADHVHDVNGDASSTADASADTRVEDARCGDGSFDARSDRCDRD